MNNDQLIGQALKSEHYMRDKLDRVRSRLETHVSTLQSEIRELGKAVRIEYTGWFALFKKQADGKWICLAVVDGNDLPDDMPDEWDVCMPIPKTGSLPEFEGW